MKTAEIRKLFLDYFSDNDHRIVAGGSLVPPNDPSLLFTNSGMVQFKDIFLGYEKVDYKRAVTVQPCLRAGGKHNDLENVGYTARHHTFFEMLGNFSFGDYFKKEAIEHAWHFLTGPLGLPAEKLWVTVYEEDDEAERLWLEHIGVDAARFARIGAHDNFWSMGDTGPCGPCSEIFYDHGPEVAGGPPGSGDEDGDRYIEVWNLVFMQFNRDAAGGMAPLPKPSVDTGMGLERVAAILQGVHSNYEIDLFRNLIAQVAHTLGVEDGGSKSLRVIADHIRSASFLIVDGVLPSNEGRGYVLRRIIRRAIRHGYQLGRQTPFMHELVGALEREMGEAYPALHDRRRDIERALQLEGERFMETLEQGMKHLEREMSALSGDSIPGAVVFKLHDTYGFPPDLVGDMARENGLKLDMEGYEAAMREQQERARKAQVFGAGARISVALERPTDFHGYDDLVGDSRVLAIVNGDTEVETISGEAAVEAVVILDATPFYGESGGQVGDRGRLIGERGEFVVERTHHLPQRLIAHSGRMVGAGSLAVGDAVRARVDADSRAAAAANHSATHLLHAALQRHLGDHVRQKGSLVAPQRLRFDFSHSQPLSRPQLVEIEDTVNREVRANHPVQTRIMERQQAMAAGAQALFGEKYEDQVRVVGMGDFSLELCGGTHVARTGDIGLFKITSEGGVASGVRRIEALSAAAATDYVADLESRMDAVSGVFQCTRDEALPRIEQLRRRNRELEQRVESLQLQLASPANAGAGAGAGRNISEVEGVKLLVARFDEMDHKSLRSLMDRLRGEIGDGVVVLGGVHDGRVHITASVAGDSGTGTALSERVRGGELVRVLAARIGGKGGGGAAMGQGGGGDAGALDDALAAAPEMLRQLLRQQP